MEKDRKDWDYKMKIKVMVLFSLFFSSVGYSLLENEACVIASNFINTMSKEIIPSWHKAKPEDPFLYYSKEALPFLWCFEIKKKNKNLGFLMVSIKDGVVQEFSTSLPPHKWNIEPFRKMAGECLNNNQILDEPHFIWLGASLYFIQFPVREDNKETGKITIDMKTNEVVDSRIPQFSKEIASCDTKGTISKIDFKLILIPKYKFYISEMTTNISSLLLYYQNNGVFKGKKLLSFENIADEFSKAGCDCEPIKTTNRFLRKLGGYKAEGKVSPYIFEDLKREIDKGMPAVLIIETGGIKHSLLARGYLKTNLSHWLILNDPFLEGISFYHLDISRYSKVNLMTLRITKGG